MYYKKNIMNAQETNTAQEQQVINQNRPKKAENFRKATGYSLTMSKLMKKWNCTTPDEWRVLRKKHKKENYIGPKTLKNKIKKELSPWEEAKVKNNGNRRHSR